MWVQDQCVDAERIAVRRERSQQDHDSGRCAVTCGQGRPLPVEPLAQPLAFLGSLGGLNQAERVPRSKTEPVSAERERAEHGLLWAPVTVTQDDSTLWNGSGGPANLDRLLDPLRAASGQPPTLQSVACGPVRVRPEERLSSTSLGGRTRRAFAIRDSLSASSPNAWRDNASEAKSI